MKPSVIPSALLCFANCEYTAWSPHHTLKLSHSHSDWHQSCTHLNARKRIEELWPPKPNEFDRATSMSSCCFSGPTRMFVSTPCSGSSRFKFGCTQPAWQPGHCNCCVILSGMGCLFVAAGGSSRGRWPLGIQHKQPLPKQQLPQQMAAAASSSRQLSQMSPSDICTSRLSRFRDKSQTCADGLHSCDGLHSACCPQQVPNHALCAVDSQVLSRQGVCDGMVLCHVTCRHQQAGWWGSHDLKMSGWMGCWVHLKMGWAGLAAGCQQNEASKKLQISAACSKSA